MIGISLSMSFNMNTCNFLNLNSILTSLLFLLSSRSVYLSDCSEILAFLPFPGKSHHAIFSSVVGVLCDSGHRVTYVTPYPMQSLSSNCTQIIISDYLKDVQKLGGMDEGNGAHFTSRSSNFFLMSVILRKIGYFITEFSLKDPKVKEIINSDKSFDLIMLETTFFQEAFIAFHHRFNAPVIEIMPPSNFHWTYYLHGNPYDTNYIVDLFNPFSDRMNFLERLINTATSLAIRASYMYYYMPKYQELMDKHFRYPGWENRPPLVEMVKNTSLVFMNSHTALNYPHPLSPHFKELGGIHLKTVKNPLPKDLQDFMDGAEHGVIYFTLGSHIQVSSTLGALKTEFVKAFSKLKQKVLWKWEKEFSDVPENVKISKWFPQQEVLAHKNVKLFISQGGLFSLMEAVSNGVPIIGIPILGDQPKNVKHLSHCGFGLALEFSNLTEQSISWAINEILDNNRYKEKAEEISILFKDEANSPNYTALFWTNYVLRHKGAHHLKPAVSRLSWFQQALLDVYLVLFLICLIPLSIIISVVKLCMLCFSAKWSSKNSSTNKKKRN